MNGWNVLSNIFNSLPSVAVVLLLLTILAIAVSFAVGFNRRGMNFIRYGFGQLALDPSLKKQFDDLAGKMATKDDIAARDAYFKKQFDDLAGKMATKDDIAARDAAFEKRFDDLTGKMATKDDIAARDAAFEKRFDDLTGKMATKDDIARLTASMATKDDIACLDAKIVVIETNHFGHLKNYLGILNGVLLDRNIIDNETRARLDNELRGM
jgi:hypothetical protein